MNCECSHALRESRKSNEAADKPRADLTSSFTSRPSIVRQSRSTCSQGRFSNLMTRSCCKMALLHLYSSREIN